MRRISAPLAVIAMGALGHFPAAGCRHAAPVPVAGASSFSFVNPPPAPPPPQRKAELSVAMGTTREVVVPARPAGPLAKPAYPPELLARRAGMATVGVHVTIDGEGRVSAIGPSLAAISSPGPFAAEFRTAVEDAVRQWRFHPGEVRRLETMHHPAGDYLRLVSSEKVEWTFDVLFTFSATGDVLSGPPK